MPTLAPNAAATDAKAAAAGGANGADAAAAFGGLRGGGSMLQPISEQQTPSTPSSAPMGSLTSPALHSSTSASSREFALAPQSHAAAARHSLSGTTGTSSSGASASSKRRAPTELQLHSTRGGVGVGASMSRAGGGAIASTSSSSRIESTSTTVTSTAASHSAVGRAASGTSYELDEADEEAFEEAERKRERDEEEELDLSTLYVGEETARAALVASQQVKRWWQDVKRARAQQHEQHIPNPYILPAQLQMATDPRWLADAMRSIRSQYRF